MEEKTLKEKQKEMQSALFSKVSILELEIENMNLSESDFKKLSFLIEKIKAVALTNSEIIRLAWVVCLCGKTKELDIKFKRLLLKELYKICNKPNDID